MCDLELEWTSWASCTVCDLLPEGLCSAAACLLSLALGRSRHWLVVFRELDVVAVDADFGGWLKEALVCKDTRLSLPVSCSSALFLLLILRPFNFGAFVIGLI